jgi:hypothetical protein
MQSCLYNNYSTIAYLFISVIFEFWHMLTISERRRVSISDTGTGIAYLRGNLGSPQALETWTTCGHKTQSKDNQGLSIQRHGQHVDTIHRTKTNKKENTTQKE